MYYWSTQNQSAPSGRAACPALRPFEHAAPPQPVGSDRMPSASPPRSTSPRDRTATAPHSPRRHPRNRAAPRPPRHGTVHPLSRRRFRAFTPHDRAATAPRSPRRPSPRPQPRRACAFAVTFGASPSLLPPHTCPLRYHPSDILLDLSHILGAAPRAQPREPPQAERFGIVRYAQFGGVHGSNCHHSCCGRGHPHEI